MDGNQMQKNERNNKLHLTVLYLCILAMLAVLGWVYIVLQDARQTLEACNKSNLEKEKEIVRLHNDLSKAHEKINELPIGINIRKALMGDGSVLVVKNNSGNTIPLQIVATSPTFGKSMRFDLVLEGKGTKEIGHMEGWPFSVGDVVELHSHGYTDKSVTIGN